MRVYNNLYSVTAQRHLGNNSGALQKSLERLSSGLRVNRGADDAAGLAISEALRGDIRSLQQASRNASDGVSMINTAEGALSEQSSILVRMRELASQAATGTVGSTERQTINREFNALRNEIDRISAVTEFNGQKLIDGSLRSGGSSVVIHVGMQATSNDRINLNTSVDLTAIDSTGLNITNISVTHVQSALDSMTRLDSAISTVTEGRGKLGAVQNRLVHTINNLAVSAENLQAAESQIRDADYASEISQFTRNQILVQASTAILAQANLVPQTVLQLLG
ncbi:MAG: flagellin FliC [Nitrospinae bacterium]|nr:flagellin FliC [Nitrospinota bacterium]